MAFLLHVCWIVKKGETEKSEATGEIRFGNFKMLLVFAMVKQIIIIIVSIFHYVLLFCTLMQKP